MTGDGRACYVYGVVPDDLGADDVVAELPAVGDPQAQVTFVRHGGLAAVVNEVPTDKALGKPDDLRAHAQVLDALAAESGPVLPFRFGTVVPDSQAVTEELLVEGHDDFVAALDQLRGSAQFTLKARYVEDEILREVLAEQPEAMRLRERLRNLPEEAGYEERIQLGQLVLDAIAAARETDSQEIERLLAPYALATALAEPPVPDGLVDASFLVADQQRHAFEQAADELARDWQRRVRIRLLGPLAPYDFASEALSAVKEGTVKEGG